MNLNLSFDLTFEANNELFEITVDASLYTESDIREAIREQLEDEDSEYFQNDDFEFIVSDWGNNPDNMQELSILAECLEDTEYCDEDVISAGIACDVSISYIDGAYAGSFGSDEEFAQDVAEQLGEIDTKNWLYGHIDWSSVAKDLMYGYSEHNGHYFRMF